MLDKAEHGPELAPAQRRHEVATKPTKAGPAGRCPHPGHGRAVLATARPRTPNPTRSRSSMPAARGEDDGLAAVIPLAVFDAREEAKKWW